MVVVEKATEYRGMLFKTLASLGPIRHEFAVSTSEKLIVDAPLTLQVHKNSYKYPEREMLLSSWGFNYPELTTRGVGASKYWRTEMILAKLTDREKLRMWYQFFMDCACAIDAILKGIV